MAEELVRVRVFVSGRVQGVAYRFFAEKYANALGRKLRVQITD